MNTWLHHPRLTPVAALVILTYFGAEWLAPSVTDIALVLSGLAVVAIAVGSAARNVIGTSPMALLVTAGVALAGTGIITDHRFTTSLDAAFAVLGAVAVVLIGAGTSLPVPLRLLLAAAGTTALIGYFALESGLTGIPGAAQLAVYPVLMSSIVLGWLHQGAAATITTDSSDEVPV